MFKEKFVSVMSKDAIQNATLSLSDLTPNPTKEKVSEYITQLRYMLYLVSGGNVTPAFAFNNTLGIYDRENFVLYVHTNSVLDIISIIYNKMPRIVNCLVIMSQNELVHTKAESLLKEGKGLYKKSYPIQFVKAHLEICENTNPKSIENNGVFIEASPSTYVLKNFRFKDFNKEFKEHLINHMNLRGLLKADYISLMFSENLEISNEYSTTKGVYVHVFEIDAVNKDHAKQLALIDSHFYMKELIDANKL